MVTLKHIPNFFSIAINSSSVKFLTSVVVVFLFSDCKKTHTNNYLMYIVYVKLLNIFYMMLADKYMLMNYPKQLVMHIRVVENNLLHCPEWIFNYMNKSKHC